MKHNIISNKKIATNESIFILELVPETETDKKLIKQVESGIPNESLNNHLTFLLGTQYSILNAAPIGNRRFELLVFKNPVQ